MNCPQCEQRNRVGQAGIVTADAREPKGSSRVVDCLGYSGGHRMADDLTAVGIGKHGAERLPSVDVDSYNVELKDENGFVGDRASKGSFQKILEAWRKPLRKSGDDPFGNKSSEQLNKKQLDEILVGDDLEAAAVVHSAVEEFAQELAHV